MDKGNEKRGLVQIVCVLLSFSLWLYVTSYENPNRSSEIKGVQVEIINDNVLKESNLALSPNQSYTIDLRIEGPASAVYAAKASDFKLTADLGNYALKKGENNIPIKVVNYPQNVNIKNTGVLSIKVNIEEYSEKYVNVVSKVNTYFEKGFSQIASTITPEAVKVFGPESLVAKVESVALMGEVKNISKDFEEAFELKAIDKEGNIIKDVTISEATGRLGVKIGKGIEVPIKVKYAGALKDGLSIEKATLSQGTVSIVGDPKELEKIEFIETEPVNLSNITGDKDIKVKLIVPNGVSLNKSDEYINLSLKIKESAPVSKTFDISVSYTGLDITKFEYTENKVSITVTGPSEVMSSITSENIKVEASVNGLSDGSHEVVWNASLVGISRSDVLIKNSTGNITVKITPLK